MSYYKTRLLPRAKSDLKRIKKYTKEYNFNRIIEKIYKDIENLKYMPKIHKTLMYVDDKNGDYRRMISGKYIIIYKILKNEIIILRIFSQKQNYLNQNKFILKEKSAKYKITS